jgi:hypothetical protein
MKIKIQYLNAFFFLEYHRFVSTKCKGNDGTSVRMELVMDIKIRRVINKNSLDDLRLRFDRSR